MRTLRTALYGLSAVCALLTVLAGTAVAATPDNLTIEVRRAPSVLWLETELPRMDADRVHIRAFAPTGRDDRRQLWQYCTIDYVGPGTYRCGVDYSKGSAARRAEGDWAARLLIDGELADRKVFEVPRL